MSSALDIQYRKPTNFSGSAYLGVLEQGLHLEGTGAEGKFTYLIGARNRTDGSLLSSQETKGTYAPSSSDIQALLTWQLNTRDHLELLGTLSQTRFHLIPQTEQLTSSSLPITLPISVWMSISRARKKTPTRPICSASPISKGKRQASAEMDGIGLPGQGGTELRHYRQLPVRRTRHRPVSSTYGQIVNPLGAGTYQDFARDQLNIAVWNLTHKGYLDLSHHYVQWGISAERQLVNDNIDEWTYQDSAGYSLPYEPGVPGINEVAKSTDTLGITRLTGFLQDNILFADSGAFTLQGGLRYNYNTLNHEFLLSPRLNASWKPRHSTKDIAYHAALGIYDQPPFFREMVRYDGTLNTALKAQRSWQTVIGFDRNFHLDDRPFRFTTEAYFKYMTRVDPYDINNVHIQYFGLNDAKAYATGIEFRLFGQLVKDAESWISMGFMRTMEKIDTSYFTYTLDSLNQPTDSTLTRPAGCGDPPTGSSPLACSCKTTFPPIKT